jgi:hypothetical protein
LSKYQYIGHTERIYMDVVQPGTGSLVVEPGQTAEFDSGPPTDGLWVLIPEAVKALVKKDVEEKK